MFDRFKQPWLIPYLIQAGTRRAPRRDEPVHLLLCIADHFEPQHGNVSSNVAQQRAARWAEEYPRLFGRFADSDGRPPQHSFFYPLEQYDAQEMDAIAGLCDRGFGDVEIHLHHDHESAESLHCRLTEYKHLLVERHGLLSRRRGSDRIVYGFIHGNWALDNARHDGRWCGVNNELDVLRESGCYADFTLPSYPDPTQTRQINSIYYACDNPNEPKSHDRGARVGYVSQPTNSLMLIQGPLLLNWRRRKWGLVPRVENACLQGNQAPTMARLDLWLRARVQIPQRPDWFFVKLHTHGATESNQRVLLDTPMLRFHEGLVRQSKENPNFHVHYVTAREMYNLARAAEAGWTGTVDAARDFEVVPQGCRISAMPELAKAAAQ